MATPKAEKKLKDPLEVSQEAQQQQRESLMEVQEKLGLFEQEEPAPKEAGEAHGFLEEKPLSFI